MDVYEIKLVHDTDKSIEIRVRFIAPEYLTEEQMWGMGLEILKLPSSEFNLVSINRIEGNNKEKT